MKTRIIELFNSRTRKTITLFGVNHIGSYDYYVNIKKWIEIIEKRDNSIILYEGVGSDESSDNESESITKLYNLVVKKCNISNQSDAIPSKSNWINTDLPYYLIKDNMRNEIDNIKHAVELLQDEEKTKHFRKIFLAMIKFRLMPEHNNFSMLELRNNHLVLETIKYAQKFDNIGIIYGDAHLDGCVKQFKQLGYELVDITKYDVLQGVKIWGK